MANSIGLAEKFLPVLDELYKVSSLTARMDAQTLDFTSGNVVKVLKLSTVGLGTYSRATGYAAGDVTASWEAFTLANDRGRKFTIDAMDDEETLGLTFGKLAGEFVRTAVAPEIDAWRFHKYAQTSSILAATPATLSATTVLAAIDAAQLAMDEAEVPAEGRILYVSATVNSFLKAALTRVLSTEKSADRRVVNLDGVDIVSVPQARFYTKITLDAGASASAGGFAKANDGKDLNFMLVHPTAVCQAVKRENLKVIAPENNPDADGYLVAFREYHDAFVYENKVNGIYIHNKA
jgi:hypothetical protein